MRRGVENLGGSIHLPLYEILSTKVLLDWGPVMSFSFIGKIEL